MKAASIKAKIARNIVEKIIPVVHAHFSRLNVAYANIKKIEEKTLWENGIVTLGNTVVAMKYRIVEDKTTSSSKPS